MKRLIFAALVAAAIPVSACTKDFDNSTVDEFDLSRYLGVWYEIARYDHSFERGMDNTMAQYILEDDGKVVVLNTGWKNGKYQVAEGKAKYPDPVGEPGALRVAFFLFFYSDYNVTSPKKRINTRLPTNTKMANEISPMSDDTPMRH